MLSGELPVRSRGREDRPGVPHAGGSRSHGIRYTSASPPLTDEEQDSYEEVKPATHGGLRIYELMSSTTENVVGGLLAIHGLLEAIEVYCLKEHA